MAEKVSASQAAKMVGKSVPTITRAIKSGKLSGEPNPNGGWLIDPSELSRVWNVTPVTGNAHPTKLGHETPHETSVLQVKLDAKQERISDLERQIEDLREQRDKWQSQAERLLLERPQVPSETPPQKPSGGFFGLFRRAG